MGCEFEFPALTISAKRLGLDACDLAESVLHAIGCGQDEQEAIRMSIVETLQRRGAYRGRLKQAVDDGTIFQMTEGGGHDGRGARQIGKGGLEPDSSASSARAVGYVCDDG